MEVEYHKIALVQLEKAIELYLNAENANSSIGEYICATTLSGAAEEILGKLLPAEMRAVKILKDGVSQLKPHIPQSFIDSYDMNKARNAYKHPTDVNKIDTQVLKLNPKEDSNLMIRRASLNYMSLTKNIPRSLMNFIEHCEHEEQMNNQNQG